MSHLHDDQDTSTATEEDVAKIRDLVKDAKICMLTTINADDMLVSRPMSTQQIEFDGAAWFFAKADQPKVAEIEANPHVNAAYSESAYVSMSGHAEIVRDDAKKKDLWNDQAAAWLQAEPTDDSVVLIKVVPDTVEYWDTPSTPSTILGRLKAKVTGDRPDGGENDTVDL
ncbi:pyridoxamine 5'-phosphate oxidase family protein [Nocardioidaceae bacterium]|nr:pyridoxamine 5'-phosphate oxidase family protein [Nocardioidaceae bacterium]